MSGSQEASLKLVGAGQDALSVNTWSHTADVLVLFFLPCDWVQAHAQESAHTCTHRRAHTHSGCVSGTLWDVVSNKLAESVGSGGRRAENQEA